MKLFCYGVCDGEVGVIEMFVEEGFVVFVDWD